MKILAFNGSPRRNGNTSLLLNQIIRGAQDVGLETEEIIADQIDLHYCRGCLKCNLNQRCVITGDDWGKLSEKILTSDVLIFASPIYFHHLTASLKKILDRFRSFIHVQITESGLVHTPWHRWNKLFVLLLCLGSSVEDDALPVIDLFKFITNELGNENKLMTIIGTRLAIQNQVNMSEDKLKNLYDKLNLPGHLATNDYLRNQNLLKKCYDVGKNFKN